MVRRTSIGSVLSLVAFANIELEQMDAKSVFLYGELEETVYMAQLEGFSHLEQEHLVCKLKKSLYRLKQSSRQWYMRFDSYIINIGYNRCEHDYCVYVKSLKDTSLIYLLLYIDDMLIPTKSMSKGNKMKTLLSREFDMKDGQEDTRDGILKRQGFRAVRDSKASISNRCWRGSVYRMQNRLIHL